MADNPDSYLSFSGDTLFFTFGFNLSEGEIYTVIPIGRDLLYNPLHRADTAYIVTDISSPYMPFTEPNRGATTTDWTNRISLLIIDDLSGVNYSSVSINLITPRCSLLITEETPGFSLSLDSVIFDPQVFNGGLSWFIGADDSLIFFHELDTIKLIISSDDNALYCGANNMADSFFFFVSDDDTLPPDILILPYPDTLRELETLHISTIITDPSGVNPDSVKLYYDTDGSISDGSYSIITMNKGING